MLHPCLNPFSFSSVYISFLLLSPSGELSTEPWEETQSREYDVDVFTFSMERHFFFFLIANLLVMDPVL